MADGNPSSMNSHVAAPYVIPSSSGSPGAWGSGVPYTPPQGSPGHFQYPASYYGTSINRSTVLQSYQWAKRPAFDYSQPVDLGSSKAKAAAPTVTKKIATRRQHQM
jgi:hypothetical protein